MSRALTLGNGQILVNFDAAARVRDFYFPRVGLENHVGGHLSHLIGVFADGRVVWLGTDGWQVKVGASADTFQGQTQAVNPELEVEITIADIVYNEKNILLRKM